MSLEDVFGVLVACFVGSSVTGSGEQGGLVFANLIAKFSYNIVA